MLLQHHFRKYFIQTVLGIFGILVYILAKVQIKMGFGTILSQTEISCIYLVQETKFLDFCEGACQYDVTKVKYWGCLYFIWYQC